MHIYISGLIVNAVRLFVNACSCSVFGSVFDVERVRCPCSGLNVFAVLHQNCCVRCSASGVVLCSVFVGSSFKSSSSFKSRHHASHFKRESGYQGISRSVLELRSTLGAQIIEPACKTRFSLEADVWLESLYPTWELRSSMGTQFQLGSSDRAL